MKTWQEKNQREKEKHVDHYSERIYCKQVQPYSFVEISYFYGGTSKQGFGFSKVNFPDKWDSSNGYNIAEKRAVRSIRKQLEQNES